MKLNLIYLVHFHPYIYLMSLECVCLVESNKEKETACAQTLDWCHNSSVFVIFFFLRRLVKSGTIHLVHASANLLDPDGGEAGIENR